MVSSNVIGVENVQINVVRTNIFDKFLNSSNIVFLIAILIIVIIFLFLIIHRLEHHNRTDRKNKIIVSGKPTKNKVTRKLKVISSRSNRIFAHPKGFSARRHHKHK